MTGTLRNLSPVLWSCNQREYWWQRLCFQEASVSAGPLSDLEWGAVRPPATKKQKNKVVCHNCHFYFKLQIAFDNLIRTGLKRGLSRISSLMDTNSENGPKLSVSHCVLLLKEDKHPGSGKGQENRHLFGFTKNKKKCLLLWAFTVLKEKISISLCIYMSNMKRKKKIKEHKIKINKTKSLDK